MPFADCRGAGDEKGRNLNDTRRRRSSSAHRHEIVAHGEDFRPTACSTRGSRMRLSRAAHDEAAEILKQDRLMVSARAGQQQ